MRIASGLPWEILLYSGTPPMNWRRHGPLPFDCPGSGPNNDATPHDETDSLLSCTLLVWKSNTSGNTPNLPKYQIVDATQSTTTPTAHPACLCPTIPPWFYDISYDGFWRIVAHKGWCRTVGHLPSWKNGIGAGYKALYQGKLLGTMTQTNTHTHMHIYEHMYVYMDTYYYYYR